MSGTSFLTLREGYVGSNFRVSVTLRKIECLTLARAKIVYHGITYWPLISLFDLDICGAWLTETVGGIRTEQSEVKF